MKKYKAHLGKIVNDDRVELTKEMELFLKYLFKDIDNFVKINVEFSKIFKKKTQKENDLNFENISSLKPKSVNPS